ncbi:MAG: hypothetical protein ACKVQS_00460 [Fimbriimonadaceae bacterium]
MKLNNLVLGLSVMVPLVAGIAVTQEESKVLSAADLKSMIDGLGYESKDLSTEVGKEKYSLDVRTSSFNIPIGAEITPSKNYVWLTANLGAVSEKTNYEGILKANGVVQPTQFYVSNKGLLMVGLPVENHGVTPVWLKKGIEKLAKDVSDQSGVWNSGG